MFNKKKEISQWKKEVLEDKKIIEAMKETYLEEKIKQAKAEGKAEAEKESQEPKTIGEYFQSFFPQPKNNTKKKPNAFMDYMTALGKQSVGKGGMFETPNNKDKNA